MSAARELFLRDGYSATTLRRVAAEAPVAERTVYSVFPNKLALFRAVLHTAATEEPDVVEIAEAPAYLAALATRSPLVAGTVLADLWAEFLERSAPLVMVMVESAGADPDLRQQLDWSYRQSRVLAARAVDAMAAHGLLAAGTHPADAADQLHALASPQVHQLLRRHSGWDAGRYRTWLRLTLVNLLAAPAPGRGHPDL